MLIQGAKESDWSRASLNTLALPGDTLWVDEGGASELEFAGGTYLRMADASKVELVALSPSAQFRGWTGSGTVHHADASLRGGGVRRQRRAD